MDPAHVVASCGEGLILNSPMAWSVVLPVKAIQQGKSRLLPPGDPSRRELAVAFLTDVLTALRFSDRVEQVFVVTDDPLVQELARQGGARPISEGDRRGLNAAVATGLRSAASGRPVVVMVGDLPCLRGPGIDLVLERALQVPRSFVCDAAGTGTTMLMAIRPELCMPQFGHRSRARHAAGGSTELLAPTAPTNSTGSVDSVDSMDSVHDAFRRARRDVDTSVDLWDAIRIGVGTATAAVVHKHRFGSAAQADGA
jgi:2-phospho-L-lactate guanylyltransferase